LLTQVKEFLANGGCQQIVAPEQPGIVIQNVAGSVAVNTETLLPHTGFVALNDNPPVGPNGTVQFTIETNVPLSPTTVISVQNYPQCGSGAGLEQLNIAEAPASPPPPPTCHCTKLSFTSKPVNFTDDHTFVFDLDYTLTCTGEPGGTCRGEIDVEPPKLKVGAGGVGTDWIVARSKEKLSCLGRCGQSNTRELRVVGHSKKMLERKLRAGKTFEIVLDYGCADRGEPRAATERKTLEIVFDKRGFLDRARSKF
jgi:hypothetical protein